jgi:hypothetical protein
LTAEALKVYSDRESLLKGRLAVEIKNFGRRRNLVRVIALIPFLVFLFSYWRSFERLLRWLLGDGLLITPDISHSFLVIGINFLCFFLLFLIWLWIASSQTIFPVTRVREIALTGLYLIFHFLGIHGIAAYVRNGRIKAFVEELQQPLPGAVMVDFNSALAIEQIILQPGITQKLMVFVRGVATLFKIDLPPVRIQGAGPAFTLPDERIHGVNDLENHPVVSEDRYWMERILGVIDLRTHFRISGRQPHRLSKRLKTSVFAYTRDGIEVKTNIWVLPTLGNEPVPYFPLNVTYVGERHPENLRVVKFKNVSARAGLYRVQSVTDDLEQSDRLEIHEHWRTISNSDWVSYIDAPRSPLTPLFNPERVFAAVYARARHHRGLDATDEVVPWFDLPVHVAIDLFREIISHYNYDEINTCDAEGNMVINQIRGKLATAMRNSGLLSYRPVFHRAGVCLEEGKMYLACALQTVLPAAAILLRTSKVLRDRGIRIIASGFGDLVVDERIYKQRLDHWRASWDRDTEVVEAKLERESLHVRTRARTQAQRELVQCLAQIYRSDGSSKEILALRVLQALEMAASDPQTRQLLPEDTFSMLRSIHDWLLPQDMGYGIER